MENASSTLSSRERVATGAELAGTLALAAYAGGLLALGAFAAPEVFAQLERNRAGSLMGNIFQRFDIATAVLLGLFAITELIRTALDRWHHLIDKLRTAAAVVALAGGLATPLWFGPQVHDLFADGARRGVGEAGAALDRAHHNAERAGKTAVAAGAIWIGLGVVAARRRRPS